MIYVYLADGFEEVETVAPVDILRRAGKTVVTVSITDKKEVKGARGVTFVADALIGEIDIEKAELIVLPGGCPGFENLAACDKVTEHIEFMLKTDRLVAAICGAPAAVLGAKGYLENVRATCYPGMEEMMRGAAVYHGDVCVDKNIITAKAAGSAIEFALTLARLTAGDDIATKVKESIVYNG